MEPLLFLSTWSIKRAIEQDTLNVNSLPELASQHGFAGIELIDRHLIDASEEEFRILNEKIESQGLQCTLGLTTDFLVEEKKAIEAQICYVREMIAYASLINARSVRILIGGFDIFIQKWISRLRKSKSDDFSIREIKKQKKLTNWLQKAGIFPLIHKLTIQAQKPRTATLKEKSRILNILDQILPVADKEKIPLAIENHWGVTTLSDNILFFVNHYSSEYLGTCVDVGNFSRWQNRYREIEKLLPWAKEIHAKSYRFDNQGEETTISYRQIAPLVKKIAPNVPLVIEYEGNGHQLQNSISTAQLIRKYW